MNNQWLEGMKKKQEEKIAKNKKQSILCPIIFLIISVALACRGIMIELEDPFSVPIGIFVLGVIVALFNANRFSHVPEKFEKYVQSVCNTPEMMETLNEEMLAAPIALVETKKERCVFTKSFVMVQHKQIQMISKDVLVLLSDIGQIACYKLTGSVSGYQVILFHNPGDKNSFKCINFDKAKDGRAFADALLEVKPDIVVKQN